MVLSGLSELQFRFLSMTTALHPPSRRRKARLQEASLIEGPMLLLQSIRGFKSNRSMLWLACVPARLVEIYFRVFSDIP